MGEIKVRKITSVDLTDLVKISRQTFTETFEEVNSEEDMQKYLSENLSEEQLQSELDNPESEFYFAENKDEILGYLKLNSGNSQTENKTENSIEIERIYVRKEFLRMKIGQLLLDHSNCQRKKCRIHVAWSLGTQRTSPEILREKRF